MDNTEPDMTVSDDKIVEAMLDAWYFGKNWRSKNVQFMRTDMLAALAAARPLIAKQAREKALDEAAHICDEAFKRRGLWSALDCAISIRKAKEPRNV